jgi:hypothetical protein
MLCAEDEVILRRPSFVGTKLFPNADMVASHQHHTTQRVKPSAHYSYRKLLTRHFTSAHVSISYLLHHDASAPIVDHTAQE